MVNLAATGIGRLGCSKPVERAVAWWRETRSMGNVRVGSLLFRMQASRASLPDGSSGALPLTFKHQRVCRVSCHGTRRGKRTKPAARKISKLRSIQDIPNNDAF